MKIFSLFYYSLIIRYLQSIPHARARSHLKKQPISALSNIFFQKSLESENFWLGYYQNAMKNETQKTFLKNRFQISIIKTEKRKQKTSPKESAHVHKGVRGLWNGKTPRRNFDGIHLKRQKRSTRNAGRPLQRFT